MNAKRIAKLVALKHEGLSAEEILGPLRYPNIVRARWEAWSIAHKQGWTVARIARAFKRDHRSIAYGLRELERRS